MPEGRNAYVVTNPMIAANRSAEVTLSKFLRVIRPSYDQVTVIGGNLSVEPDLDNVELVSFDMVRADNKIKRAMSLLAVQLKMRAAMEKRIQKNDPVFFWIGDKMLFPFQMAMKKEAEINYFIMGNVAKEGTESKFTRISEKLIRYMAEHATYVCMESKSVINEWPGLSTDRTRVIHLYTDRIEMNPVERREKILGMVCRLTEGKHVLECIEAMALLHEQYPQWRLEIIGSGRQQEECERRIANLNAGDYVELLGWVEHDKIVEKSKKWKYLLFPTDTEGMPNGLLEMMGQGIPALASPVGGVQDIVRDGENGFLLPDCSVSAIKNGIERMVLTDEATYAQYAAAAFSTVDKEYSQESAIKNARSVIGAKK